MRIQTILFGALFSISSAAASAAVYDCDIDKKVLNWVPQKIVIAHNAGSKVATVNDPIIHHFMGKPISARVKHNNEKRITFGWSVRIKDSKGQRAEMIYRATYLKATGKMSLIAKPAGYSNNFSSNGTCKVS